MLDTKKTWSNPEIIDLSVTDTKGGPIYTEEADGPAQWDQNTGKWWEPHGTS